MGVQHENRVTGNAAKVLKSRLLTLAASPAFSDSTQPPGLRQPKPPHHY